MAPKNHLPPSIPQETIHVLLAGLGLPPAASITALDVTADYHVIYRIQLITPVPPGMVFVARKDNGSRTNDLILRVAGNHLPEIKTRNEIGVMAWLSSNAAAARAIPVPDVVAYDATSDNLLGHEYTLLSQAPGKTLRDVWPDLNPTQRDAVLGQLVDVLMALHGSETWTHIGGLNVGDDGQVVPARVVDESFWQTGDLPLWPAGETVTTLNLAGPYASWTVMVAAQVRHYVRLIGLHESLAFLQDSLVPRLLAFAGLLESPATHPADWKLVETRLVLTHKDLHFANLLYDPDKGITAVLDWEFAGVVPGPLWNPRRAFLWPARTEDPDSSAKTRQLVAQFEDKVRARNDPTTTALLLDAQKYASPQQEAIQDVADYLRALVEVCPRGLRADRVDNWVAIVHKNLDVFRV